MVLAPPNGGREGRAAGARELRLRGRLDAELIAAAEGQPVKNIVARAGAVEARGELLITRHGLEGGAIYQLGPAVRTMGEPVLFLDLKPTFSAEQLAAKLGPAHENLHAITRERCCDSAKRRRVPLQRSRPPPRIAAFRWLARAPSRRRFHPREASAGASSTRA